MTVEIEYPTQAVAEAIARVKRNPINAPAGSSLDAGLVNAVAEACANKHSDAKLLELIRAQEASIKELTKGGKAWATVVHLQSIVQVEREYRAHVAQVTAEVEAEAQAEAGNR